MLELESDLICVLRVETTKRGGLAGSQMLASKEGKNFQRAGLRQVGYLATTHEKAGENRY